MKRTRLRRSTALSPGKVRLKRTQLRRLGKRQQRQKGALEEFRRHVLKIDAITGEITAWCALCGPWSGVRARDAHHLCPRSRGAGHPMLHDPRNGIALCRGHHNEAHSGTRPDLIYGRDFLDRLLQT